MSVSEAFQQFFFILALVGLFVCLFVQAGRAFLWFYREVFGRDVVLGIAVCLLSLVAVRVGGSKPPTHQGDPRRSASRQVVGLCTEAESDRLTEEDRSLRFTKMEPNDEGILIGLAWPESMAFVDGEIEVECKESLATNGWSSLASVPAVYGSTGEEVLIPYEEICTDGQVPSTCFLRLHAEEEEGDWTLDSDGDGLPDLVETKFLSSLTNRDTDGDGISDADERRIGGNPNAPETLSDLRLGLQLAAPNPVISGEDVWAAPDGRDGETIGSYSVEVTYGQDTEDAGLSVYGIGWPHGTRSEVTGLEESVEDEDTDGVFHAVASGAYFRPRASGFYSFQLAVDDAATLRIGEKIQVTGTWSSDNRQGLSATVRALFVEGNDYPISVTWDNFGGRGSLSFPVWGVFAAASRPTVNASFSASRIYRSRSKAADSPKRAIRKNELTSFRVSASGGAFGGTLYTTVENAEKLAHVALEEIPSAGMVVASGRTIAVEGVYRGAQSSQEANDVRLTVRFVENETGRELTQTAALTVEEPVLQSLSIRSLKFDHDRNNYSEDAISIRANKETAFDNSQGEWVDDGVANNPVCYTVCTPATVKARLDLGISIDANLDVYAETEDFAFGNLKRRTVNFKDGVGVAKFTCATPVVDHVSVGDGSITWKIADTSIQRLSGPHHYYVVFDGPQPPWSNAAGSNKNAWTNALEFACHEANGAVLPATALAGLTQALFDFGYRYDTRVGASTFCGNNPSNFDLSGYLIQTATNVNCRDQAYCLSTLSRLLGIDARIKLKQPFGYICETTLVGGIKSNNPFFEKGVDYCPHAICTGNDHESGLKRSFFVNHEYVVFGGKVFDACTGPSLGEQTEQEYAGSIVEQEANIHEVINIWRTNVYDLR